MTRTKLFLSGLATTALTALPALAQDTEITPLTDYDVSEIQGAWSADSMLDAEVYGVDGELVGNVQNIIVGADNMVERIVMETDNWFDIADRTISVPYDEIDLTPDSPGISAPFDEDEMNDFDLFGSDDDVYGPGGAYRISEVLGEYASTEDGVGYGYVTDVIFDENGQLSSTLVSVDVGFGDDYADGYYAYPYYGTDYGYDPYEPGYTLPYTEEEVLDYDPIDTDFTDDDI